MHPLFLLRPKLAFLIFRLSVNLDSQGGVPTASLDVEGAETEVVHRSPPGRHGRGEGLAVPWSHHWAFLDAQVKELLQDDALVLGCFLQELCTKVLCELQYLLFFNLLLVWLVALAVATQASVRLVPARGRI